jgi:hypothetical protein
VSTVSLSLTRGLRQWLAADPAWATLPLQQRALLHWQATMGSVNAGLARLNAPKAAPGPALQAPLLVLGPWRSGTTVMHELLSAATGLATPRTWQCMDATAFEAMPPRRRGTVAVARPMDGLAISAASPQEDEFALLTLGADSAYRAFWMPHRIGQLHAALEPGHWLADERWLAPWEQFLGGVLRVTPGARQPLLLKSPNHSFRLPSILRRFPDTRVAWMLRDGAEVYHSNLKMWRAMFAQHGLTAPLPGALEDFIAHALRACADVLDQTLSAMPRGRWVVVPQARLRAEAAAVVREVHARLQLPGPLDETALQAAMALTATGREDHYAAGISHAAATSAVRAFNSAQLRALELQQAGCTRYTASHRDPRTPRSRD